MPLIVVQSSKYCVLLMDYINKTNTESHLLETQCLFINSVIFFLFTVQIGVFHHP